MIGAIAFAAYGATAVTTAARYFGSDTAIAEADWAASIGASEAESDPEAVKAIAAFVHRAVFATVQGLCWPLLLPMRLMRGPQD